MNNENAKGMDWEGLAGLPKAGEPVPIQTDPTDSLRDMERENELLTERIRDMMDKADEGDLANWIGAKGIPTAPPPKAVGIGEPEKNEKLLIDIDCVKDSETGEYHLIIKAGIRIGSKEVLTKEKKELSEVLFKRIKRLIDELNKKIKNKATLIELLK